MHVMCCFRVSSFIQNLSEVLCAQLLTAMVAGAPKRDVVSYTKVIKGVDMNDITLYISEPKDHGAVPCILHCHGGEMAVLTATNGFNTYLRER
eukprot:1195758-Prorocentrum_minimum.AAC.2